MAKENYLDRIPVRNESERPWEEKEDGIIEVTVENKGFYNKIAQVFLRNRRTLGDCS